MRRNPVSYQYWRMKSLSERKLYHLFDLEIERCIELSLQNIYPHEGTELFALHNSRLLRKLEKTSENLKYQLEHVQLQKLELNRHLLYSMREIESQEAFLRMRLQKIEGAWNEKNHDQRTEGETPKELRVPADKDVYAQNLLLKKHTFQTSGLLRIEVMKQMLAIAKNPLFNMPNSQSAYISLLNNIAIEYIELNMFREADEYLEESIEGSLAYKQNIYYSNIQNYISNVLNIEKYSEGISIHRRFEAEIRESPWAVRVLLDVAYCHLFLKQPEEALALIPPASAMNERDTTESRMIYAISFFIRKDYELAHTECMNLKRSDYVVKAGNDDFMPFTIKLLARYFAAFVKPKASQQKDLLNLKRTMEKEKVKIIPQLKYITALRWLWIEALENS